ncbi:hypothetical protein BJY16_002313 [Actinoplanes octamycinicus]|uniref:DUF1707 domain-containing protein n=2 Tax=Actinoplanes octamycinicus TaxID=135948 RepID=A0A7W7GV24_9ACTN|nr:DUF1707 domain-containing protein [Actinoplanes octamycinicus]MBB4738854.1 hypothetical protein [Actinoplanes octamycinicus]GIE63207.1 hypothetical protein Aoc01nite_86090 [Actinoplanes octamycinicus]
MGREGMRAGDSDRQRVADQLKTALDEGRLDLNEYDERVQRAYSARTYADLDGLLDDLPGTVPPRQSQVQPHAPAAHPAAAPVGRDARGHGGRHTFQSALTAFLICTVIWAVTSFTAGHAYYFWPAWVLIPVIITGVGALTERGRRDR